MNAQTTHVALPRIDYGCTMNSVLSFTVGAVTASAVCAVGFLIYQWFWG